MVKVLFIIFTILYCRQKVLASTNFTACYIQLPHQNLTNGAVDEFGIPVTNLSNAVGYDYEHCLKNCGADPVPLSWPEFSQQFAAWFLPWLALITQLPYGANDRLSNFEVIILTAGSPMLAAYSLALAVTSNRWMIKRFGQSSHPRARLTAKALSNLQQVSLVLPKETDVLPSLIVLRENDKWWEKVDEGLDYAVPRCTLSAIMSILYGVVAYTFTWISTWQGHLTGQVSENGQTVGSLWLSLLPIVTCYLQISPKSDGDRIRKAVESANKRLHVATETGEPVMALGMQAITVKTADHDVVYEDQICTTPISFYARVFTWSQVARQATDAFEAVSIHESKNERNGIGPRTEEDVIKWCTLDDNQDNSRVYEFLAIQVRSALLAFFLQCGTTCAAIMAFYLTPTRGFGCRSVAYLLYASSGIVVWILMVISSSLAHSYTASKERGQPAKFTGAVVVIFRQLGKTLAALNTAWIILSIFFQFSNIYNNCYCNASVLSLGRKAAYVSFHRGEELIKLTKLYWALGMGMASGTALLFIFAINLLKKQPESH